MSSLLNNLPTYSSDSFRALDDAQLPLPPPSNPPKRYTATTHQHVKPQPIKREKVNCLIRALANTSVERANSSATAQRRATKRARLQRPPSTSSNSV